VGKFCCRCMGHFRPGIYGVRKESLVMITILV